jgi:uncharacterized protein with von Willebrand factor type A (vWA) domain
MRNGLELSIVKQNKIDKSLRELIKTLDCPEIAELPIYLDYSDTAPPAYTTQKGIWIRQDIAYNAPEQISKYLLHEIMHHVVKRAETGKFDSFTVNIAEDYIINYILDTTFGMGKASDFYVQGIYNAKLAKIGLANQTDLCLKVLEKRKMSITDGKACGCTGLAHPTIKYVADRLKRWLGYNLKSDSELVQLDDNDRSLYKLIRPKFEDELAPRYNLPLNMDSVIQGMYFKRTKFMSMAKLSDSRYFSPEELFIAGWETKVHPSESEDATVYAIHSFLTACSKEQDHINFAIRKLHMRIATEKGYLVYYKKIVATKKRIAERLRHKSNRKPTDKQVHAEYVRLVKRSKNYVIRAEKRLKIFESWLKMPLYNLLVESKIVSKNHTRQSLRGLSSQTNMSAFPYIGGTAVGKRLKFLSSLFKNENDLDELIKDLRDAVKNTPSSASDEKEGDQTPKDEGEEPDNGDNTGEGETNGGEDKKEADKRKQNDPAEGQSPGGQSAGKMSSNLVYRLNNLRPYRIELLKNIVSHKNEFDTMITKNRSKKSDENRPALETVPSFGSDVARIDQMELALLNNPITKLMQLAKLANSELSMRVPSERKRRPIIFMLDGSGSMMSNDGYSMAAGFCLSMAEKLSREKRGWAFIGFDYIPHSITSSEQKAIDFAKSRNMKFIEGANGFIDLISRPSFGGTDFYNTISCATDLRIAMEWQGCEYIMITDGDDSVGENESRHLREKMNKEDKFLSLLVAKHTAGLQYISDKMMLATQKNMKTELTELGVSLL